ncbi:hypothetical protein EYC59_02845 [Candidatus Saccharibacteria bacterium]|nr:MAG: hypothetical protein EYC59_02845 [Candidatus Saccharibacteria bacterium]
MQPDYSPQARTKLITAVVAVLVVAGSVLVIDHLKSEAAESSPVSTTSQTMSNATSSGTTSTGTTSSGSTNSTASSGTYKDGTYTASSDYYVPHGYENIAVSVTLKSGVISNVSITNSEGDRESAGFQEEFASAYKSYVVGKSIDGLQLGIVSGASDTTQGFNAALDKIASQAQA